MIVRETASHLQDIILPEARQYADANQSAIERIALFIRERKISCDFIRKPAYTYAEKPEALEAVENEVKAAQILGLPAFFAEKVPLPFETQGAVCLKDQAQFHPRKYLLALADAIIEAGGQIYERTRALNIEEGEPSTITVEGGTVKARDVIIASHTPFCDKAGFLSKRLFPQRTYMIAVRTREPFPEGIFIGSDDFGHSLRSQRDSESELVLIGGEDHPSDRMNGVDHYQALAGFAHKIYPSPSIEYRWAGQYNETVDKVPYIGKFSSCGQRHLFVATGFRGWGMTGGTAAAMILTDLILRGSSPWASVYDPARLG